MSLDKIIDDKLPSWKRWRVDFASQFQRAELLERFAEASQLPEGFRIAGDKLDWTEWGHNHASEAGKTSLNRFRTMILATANRLGRPEKVEEQKSYFDEVPNLHAQWTVKLSDGSEGCVHIWILAPKGCKIDPRVPAKKADWGTPAELHPECKAVLRELEELEA